MGRNLRDIARALTVTNSEDVTTFDADTATLTVTSNALAMVVKALQEVGIMTGSVT